MLHSMQVSLLQSNIHAEFPDVTCKMVHCFSVKDVARKIQYLCSNSKGMPDFNLIKADSIKASLISPKMKKVI